MLRSTVPPEDGPLGEGGRVMLTIEFPPDQRKTVEALAASHSELIKQVKASHSIGGGHDLTLLISAAAIVVPAIKAVLIEKIKAGKFKTFSYKGLKISGQNASPENIARILESLKESESKK
jgi:hypothetical protein